MRYVLSGGVGIGGGGSEQPANSSRTHAKHTFRERVMRRADVLSSWFAGKLLVFAEVSLSYLVATEQIRACIFEHYLARFDYISPISYL